MTMRFYTYSLSNEPAPPASYTLSLHDALPILLPLLPLYAKDLHADPITIGFLTASFPVARSEEHTSELQSRLQLVCGLLLEKKKVEEEITYFAIVAMIQCHNYWGVMFRDRKAR